MNIAEYLWAALHPTHEDLVTSCFDLVFVYSGIKNVRCLIRDKMVKGFDWRNMCLYVAWNIWSIWVIYPTAKLALANAINCVYLLSQLVWLALLAKYTHDVRRSRMLPQS